MNDTPPEVDRIHRAMLLARSGEERLAMCFSMFDLARSLVLAGLRAEGRDRLRERLFLRTYGNDFSAEERERIVARLRAS